MMDRLQGAVAVVTGGSRGIGRAIALGLAAAGADVAINFRSREAEAAAVVEAAKRLGRRAVAIRADITRVADAERLVAETTAVLGPVTVLVNNAGVGQVLTLGAITERDWDDTFAVNLKAAFFVAQAVLPGMRQTGWGRILNLSSVAAQTGGSIGPHYAASKAGIIGLTHSLAALLAKDGITVNAIAPGPVETDMLASNPQIRPDRVPLGRFGVPDEVAGIALALLRNGFVTGQTVNVNGGLYMGS